MDMTTKNMINSLAEDIIRRFNIEVPIYDMDSVVRILGGSILTDRRILESKVVKNGNSFIIWVSPYWDENRTKFAVAHELGNLFLHMGYMINDELWNSDNVTNSIEKVFQANEFAGAMLMPREAFTRQMEKCSDGKKVNLVMLAEFFHVSVADVSFRGRSLGYFGTGIFNV